MRARRVTEEERGDEIKKLQKTILQTQNTVYRKTKPNSLLKTEIKTCNSSVFSERLLHGERRKRDRLKRETEKQRGRDREKGAAQISCHHCKGAFRFSYYTEMRRRQTLRELPLVSFSSFSFFLNLGMGMKYELVLRNLVGLIFIQVFG